MMIAVVAVNVVQMTSNQVVHMITMGNCLMSAARAMFVALFMAIADVIGSASCRVGGGNLNHMFIDMIFMHGVQVSVM